MLVGVGLREYWSFGGLRMLAVYNTVVDSLIVAGSTPERELEMKKDECKSENLSVGTKRDVHHFRRQRNVK